MLIKVLKVLLEGDYYLLVAVVGCSDSNVLESCSDITFFQKPNTIITLLKKVSVRSLRNTNWFNTVVH